MPELDVSLPHVLVPMDRTLPGWPAVDNPPMLVMLLLIVGVPVAIAAVFVIVGMAGRWRRQTPATPGVAAIAAPRHSGADGAPEGLPAPAPAATTALSPAGQLPGSATPAPVRRDVP